MSQNKIQFQNGLSLIEFNEHYLCEEACSQKVQEMRWPQGFKCDKCQHPHNWTFRRGHKDIFQCKSCKHQCSLTAGTLFERTQLPLTTWFLAIHLISQSKNSVSALELHRQLRVNYKTAWLLKHKIMEAMFDGDRLRKLSGRVEVDDAYLGGKEEGGGIGGGFKKKAPFLAAVQINDQGHPLYARFSSVKDFTQKSINDWAQENLVRGTRVVTSGLPGFAVLSEFASHEVHLIKRGGKEVHRSAFYWVNTVLSNVKTSISGTFHSIKFNKYGFRYLADLQFRFNRRFDLKKLFYSVIKQAVAHRPCPRRFLESVITG